MLPLRASLVRRNMSTLEKAATPIPQVTNKAPTKHSTFPYPQNPWIDVSELRKVRLFRDTQARKLGNFGTGSHV